MSLNYIIKGDYGFPLEITVIDVDTDQPADLTQHANTVQMLFKDPNAVITAKNASFVTDGSDGLVKYDAEDGDFDIAGTWYVRVSVASLSAKLSTEWGRFPVFE